MLSLVWSMVFDHVGSSGTAEYTEYTEYTAPPKTEPPDTSAPEAANAANAAKEAIPTEIKNMGALSVLIALLPEVTKHDQHATLLNLLAVCQGAVGIQNRSA